MEPSNEQPSQQFSKPLEVNLPNKTGKPNWLVLVVLVLVILLVLGGILALGSKRNLQKNQYVMPTQKQIVLPSQQKQQSFSNQQTPSTVPTITSSQPPSGTAVVTSECSYPSNMCSVGYECYTSVSGGLGPQGPLPVKVMGGDQKCHKICKSNQDCEGRQRCIRKDLQREDYTITVNICL